MCIRDRGRTYSKADGELPDSLWLQAVTGQNGVMNFISIVSATQRRYPYRASILTREIPCQGTKSHVLSVCPAISTVFRYAGMYTICLLYTSRCV